MKKYGLQLRVQPSLQKKQPSRPPLPPPLGFRDDDEDDVESEIARQAFKSKSVKDIEEQHKKALEADPSIFDYDGIYDEMKEKVVRPLAKDREERKPKYIQALIEKAKQREREHEIIYERKIAKERSKDDHLFADKDKYVTSAYKKKLAEQQKWSEEERLREIREEKDDVTKKSDMSDFYFNLQKNVAFGAKVAESRKPRKKEEKSVAETSEKEVTENDQPSSSTMEKEKDQEETLNQSRKNLEMDQEEIPNHSKKNIESSDATPQADTAVQENIIVEKPTTDQTKQGHHKRTEDALAAARERFKARKKAKVL